LKLVDLNLFYISEFQIGAAYAKDAYVQNELVLAALKTATEHLVAGGSFCTKVYRSTDYNALIWVFQQLFEEVQAMKPNSSRSQSSEIFIVCLKYTAPNSIDPKLLDPNHVFKEVNDPGLQKVDVMHKKYDKLNKRHRTGYDESLGPLLTSKVSVLDFIHAKDTVAAIRVLTDANIIEFPEDCDEMAQHPATTDEIRLCLTDLRVLGKLDFKKIIKWRETMRTFFFSSKKKEGEDDDEAKEEEAKKKRIRRDDELMDVDVEIERLNSQIEHADKKDKKKDRTQAAKERRRQVLGISANAFGDDVDQELFALGHKTKASQLEGVNEVDLDDDEDENHEIWMEDYKKVDEKPEIPSIILTEEDLEEELEGQYKRFTAGKRILTEQNISEEQQMLKDTRDEKTLDGRQHSLKAQRLSRTSSALLDKNTEEDEEMGDEKSRSKAQAMNTDLESYVKMLSGKKVPAKAHTKGKNKKEGERVIESDTSEDEGEEEGNTYTEGDDEGPLSSQSVRLSGNARADKWFTHPIFNESLLDKSDLVDEEKKNHRRANQVNISVVITFMYLTYVIIQIVMKKVWIRVNIRVFFYYLYFIFFHLCLIG
jgi:AdoMet-dependent rRNA methyltransferase SPB1